MCSLCFDQKPQNFGQKAQNYCMW